MSHRERGVRHSWLDEENRSAFRHMNELKGSVAITELILVSTRALSRW